MQGDYTLMALFRTLAPDDVIAQMMEIGGNIEDIMGQMTKAGAEQARKQMMASCPSELTSHIALSRTYKTPSDGGINTKVYFKGYIPFSDPNRLYFTRRGGNGTSYSTSKGVPADFLAIMYEYGRSGLPFPKRPFVRRAFNSNVEQAMLKAQRELSGGLLE